MRFFLGASLMVFAVGWLAAADEPKPNTLTPKESADGWLLLFDGATTFGWSSDGTVQAAEGALAIGGDKAATARFGTQFGDDYELQLEYRRTRGNSFLNVETKDGKSSFSLGGPAPKEKGWSKVTLASRRDPQKGLFIEMREGAGKGSTGPAPVEPGRNVVALETQPGSSYSFRNIKLRPLGLKSIFNGKDLAGWKEFPGRKSKFAVQGGAINIKDGPGDLQTEGRWADFVLQLECISNGKHLNSGVFFRCIPDQYQQGYEAQVRNQFTAEPTQEYSIETYDPESGKVIKTEKTKSPAVDYGTGAIYRRMPARKQVAKDGEWFTLTVVAHGRHIATWVNGLQVADWTDTRPLNANARNGCRLEKGPISLQGHDPTTDLSFRNFRIGEIAGEKK